MKCLVSRLTVNSFILNFWSILLLFLFPSFSPFTLPEPPASSLCPPYCHIVFLPSTPHSTTHTEHILSGSLPLVSPAAYLLLPAPHCICNAACTARCDCWMGVGLQKDAPLCCLFALTLRIKQTSSTPATTPVS